MFFIGSRNESLGAIFDLHNLGCCMFSSRIWALDIFPIIRNPRWALSQTDGSFLSVKSMILDLLCISSSRGQWFLFFLEFENSIFVMFLWLGSSPTISVAFPQCSPSWKTVFVFPSDFEERPHPLECCWWIRFWPHYGQNILGIWPSVSGLFLPFVEINSVVEVFSSTQKWCILFCMQLVFGLCRSGKESAWKT